MTSEIRIVTGLIQTRIETLERMSSFFEYDSLTKAQLESKLDELESLFLDVTRIFPDVPTTICNCCGGETPLDLGE
jgi:hypothetical protein